ncbi:MAG: TonB-dependent receptor [Flavobacteriales bacterium]|nr:TonB-dependent receptor [Flavobacteriales bacterium]
MALFLTLPCWCSAQTASGCDLVLSGTVMDEHDHTPLAFAEVSVPALGRGTVTDEQGRFRLEGLCAGSLVVRVDHLGCEPIERRIEVREERAIELFLEHHTEELRELEVVRERPDEHVGQAHDALDKHAMERSSGKTLAEMLATIPGVNTLNSGPTISKPVIHGLSGNRILTLNQGVRQEDQQWGTEHAPNLDPFSSDRITVVKGAASVQYGSDALGGVVITRAGGVAQRSGDPR